MYLSFSEYSESAFLTAVHIGFLSGFLPEDLGFRADNVTRNKQPLLPRKSDLDQNLCTVSICGCLEDSSLSHVRPSTVRPGGAIFGRSGFGDTGRCVQCGDKLENRFFSSVSSSCDCDFFYSSYNLLSFSRLFVTWDRSFPIEFVIGISHSSSQRNSARILAGGFRVQCRQCDQKQVAFSCQNVILKSSSSSFLLLSFFLLAIQTEVCKDPRYCLCVIVVMCVHRSSMLRGSGLCNSSRWWILFMLSTRVSIYQKICCCLAHSKICYLTALRS